MTFNIFLETASSHITRKALACILLCSLLSACFLPGEFTPIKTKHGTLIGTDNGQVKAFLGVRYAQPPVGNLRWAPPEPLLESHGYKPAILSGAGCIQGGKPTGVFNDSEDCLYLDIWAPSEPGEYPVMVWLHGGGLLLGAGSEMQYRGEKLAQEKKVIVVNVNSRLSFIGYVASPELSQESAYAGSGNQGFLDQIEALKWVKSQIHHFGGNPNNVTLFGESGGAIGVCTLIASPLADALFHKAILQSGSCRMLRTPNLAGGEAKGKAFFEKIGCGNAENPLACGRALPISKIVDSLSIDMNEIFIEHPDTWAYYPTPNIDGHFLTAHPISLIEKGSKPDIPVLIGTNKNEGSLFVGLRDHSDNNEDYLNYLRTFYGSLAENFAQVYPLTDYSSAGEAAAALAGDGFMDCPAKEMGNLMSDTQHPVYMYQFVQPVNSITTDIILELQKGENAPAWGVFHSAEIPYVFGVASVLGNLDTPERKRTKNIMMSYWANFAYTGDPNGEGLPQWPEYNSQTARYMMLGENFNTGANLKPTQCDFWLNTFFARGYW